MHTPDPELKPATIHPSRRWAWLPVGLALLAAAPSLRGTFLPGDDVQLIRDHVLVNRLSLAHLVELFSVPHRDLYQPVPMAAFSLEFWVMRRLGLTPENGAWINHLGNILIHAANTWLVFILLTCVAGRREDGAPHAPLLALAGASLFAIHPMNIATVAWLSGRMMMLSTLFTLLAVIQADKLLDRRSAGLTLGVVVATALAMMSKISVALPLLMLLLPWLRRQRPTRTWWLALATASLITLAFVALNVGLSRRQLASAGEALEGSRWARSLLALAWYVSHYAWPAGLAPWHPADALVTFADPRIPSAAILVSIFAFVCVVAARIDRASLAAVVWFLATLAPTLPLVPSRNVLVAERYLYLPGIGLHWLAAVLMGALALRLTPKLRTRPRLALAIAAALLVVAPLVAAAWQSAGHYRDNVARFERIAELYPNHNEVWPRLAWALYDAGRYHDAIQAAEREFEHVPAPARSEVLQVQGMALLRLRRTGEALSKLDAAVAADPKDEMGFLRLATAQLEAGRLEEAARSFRRSAELMPNYPHSHIGLGQTLRRLNRAAEAAEAFRAALKANERDPLANVALAELELAAGQVQSAAGRLERLLAWMPEHATAHANLGVCYQRLGRPEAALREFRTALRLDPALTAARLNLAAALAQQGKPQEADQEFARAAELTGYRDRSALIAYSDFLTAQNRLAPAGELWARAMAGDPTGEAAAWYAWISALAGQWDPAAQTLAALDTEARQSPAAALAEVLLQVHAAAPQQALDALEPLLADPSAQAADARARLQSGLRSVSEREPENPWPYLVMIHILAAEGNQEAARLGLAAFEELCHDEAWKAKARALARERTGD